MTLPMMNSLWTSSKSKNARNKQKNLLIKWIRKLINKINLSFDFNTSQGHRGKDADLIGPNTRKHWSICEEKKNKMKDFRDISMNSKKNMNLWWTQLTIVWGIGSKGNKSIKSKSLNSSKSFISRRLPQPTLPIFPIKYRNQYTELKPRIRKASANSMRKVHLFDFLVALFIFIILINH